MTASPATSAQGKPRVKKRWFAYFGLNSLGLSILLHLLFGIGAAFLIVEHFQKKHVNFHATEPPAQHTEIEHKVELAKRNNVESAPPDLKRIVSTDVAAITLPDPPEVPTTDEPDPTPIAAVVGVMGSAISDADGNGGSGNGGGGSGGGGGMTMYGAPDGVGLRGSFYDLKQTPDGQPTDIAESDWEKSHLPDDWDPDFFDQPNSKKYLEVLRRFINSWDEGDLANYFKASGKLSLDQICIHEGPSSLAPAAFNVGGKVVARRWIAIYSAKVLPPDSGTYRFVGCADDLMIVNVDDRNVLDACNSYQVLDPALRSDDAVGAAWPGFTLRAGRWFDLEQGTPVKIKILIGEGPGGSSGFVLMIQRQGDTSAKGDYPIFQVKDVPIPDMNLPNFSKKKMLFQVSTDGDQ